MSPVDVSYSLSPELEQEILGWRRHLLLAGVVALVLCAIGAFFSPAQFFQAYLWSYMFVLGLVLGSMALVMLQYLSGGAWGIVIRRIGEAAFRTLPLVAVLFVPIAIGIPWLYPWADAKRVAADEILRHKHAYLNVPFFLIRATLYFAGWIVFAYLLNRWSTEEDRAASRELRRKLQLLSGPGLVFWGLSVTFMAIDWIMSIDAHWYSTMFGLLFMAGQGLSALSFAIAVVVVLMRRQPFADAITPRHLHDLGKLLLAFVMVWTYFAFSQWLIVWSGNLSEEIPWYVERLHGGWQYLALALILFHFALPFTLLLSRELKRAAPAIRTIALCILVMRLVDLYWLVAPDFRKGQLAVSWMDFVAPIGLVGIWLWAFAIEIGRRPLLPVGDPHLEEALQHGR